VNLQTHEAKGHEDKRRIGEFIDRSSRSSIGEGIIPMMAPPKFKSHIQIARKTHSSHRSPQETTKAEKVFTQTEGIVDVDAIHSPQIEPVNATLVEEEGNALMMVRMDINSHNSARVQDPLATRNPQQPSRVEATHKPKGMDIKRIDSDGTRSQPMVGYKQQEEVELKYIMGKQNSGWEEKEPEAGTSSTLV
jgi:hypothetical protein